jgi:hypothetical protein
MKAQKIFLIIALIYSYFPLSGQNFLWLNNGKQIKIGDFRIENKDTIFYSSLKGKDKFIETFDVFSVIDKSGKETIVYEPDTTFVGAFTVPQMKNFVLGQYDASQKFKSPGVTAGGIAVSGVSSLLINPVFVFAVSGAYCTGIGISPTCKKRLNIPDQFVNDEHYILGYKRTTKHQRIKNAIIGSGSGLVVGLGTFAIINNK